MEFRLTTIQLAQLVAKACGKVARLVTLPVGNNAGQVGKTGGSHLTFSRRRLQSHLSELLFFSVFCLDL